ncbi:uncharacterized protein M6B38_278185 [Iris pallida]|uniref:Uncharacterized protein n=1 Tax=Iris pallida TaxID=29817 RepID=A0AAX6HY92_IRIPA|nr:uncharacterized protein M6B38_278185 [Iris pallida]
MNSGAALIDLETRASSWVYRTRSDILSQQFDHSGNIVLCGQRNGAIIAVDVRQKQSRCLEVPSTSLTTSSSVRHDKRSTKQKFEIKDTSTSGPFLPSSVCSLVALRSDDQYFLGGSMDGSIKLFDRRLLQRGAVQSYEGHVNSHSNLQLGVNPSETLILSGFLSSCLTLSLVFCWAIFTFHRSKKSISGGEDCCVRMWSLKSSELVFEENVSNSIISTVCWRRGMDGFLRRSTLFEDNPLEINHSHGAWLGSVDGIHYMHVA